MDLRCGKGSQITLFDNDRISVCRLHSQSKQIRQVDQPGLEPRHEKRLRRSPVSIGCLQLEQKVLLSGQVVCCPIMKRTISDSELSEREKKVGYLGVWRRDKALHFETMPRKT